MYVVFVLKSMDYWVIDYLCRTFLNFLIFFSENLVKYSLIHFDGEKAAVTMNVVPLLQLSGEKLFEILKVHFISNWLAMSLENDKNPFQSVSLFLKLALCTAVDEWYMQSWKIKYLYVSKQVCWVSFLVLFQQISSVKMKLKWWIQMHLIFKNCAVVLYILATDNKLSKKECDSIFILPFFYSLI